MLGLDAGLFNILLPAGHLSTDKALARWQIHDHWGTAGFASKTHHFGKVGDLDDGGIELLGDGHRYAGWRKDGGPGGELEIFHALLSEGQDLRRHGVSCFACAG